MGHQFNPIEHRRPEAALTSTSVELKIWTVQDLCLRWMQQTKLLDNSAECESQCDYSFMQQPTLSFSEREVASGYELARVASLVNVE